MSHVWIERLLFIRNAHFQWTEQTLNSDMWQACQFPLQSRRKQKCNVFRMHKQDSRYFLLPYTECQRCIILFVITSTQLFTWFGSVNHNITHNSKSTLETKLLPWSCPTVWEAVLVQNKKDQWQILPCGQNDQNDQCDGCKAHGYLGDHNLWQEKPENGNNSIYYTKH